MKRLTLVLVVLSYGIAIPGCSKQSAAVLDMKPAPGMQTALIHVAGMT